MKKILSLAFLVLLLTACGVNGGSKGENGGSGVVTDPDAGATDGHIFPASDESGHYVGDVMPYYENGKFYIYYLNDQRAGSRGYHPIWLTETTDFTTYSAPVEAIPFVPDYSSQDLAIGTGSLLKDNSGIYHFWYTGHNDTNNVYQVEKLQHATSTDLHTWTKHPLDGFYGPSYAKYDFRDPYLLYMASESKYWMLVTTKNSSNESVIEKYTSTDLVHWTDAGVFYKNTKGTYNMECPTLFKKGEYWYLTFSAQLDLGQSRTVNYRYSTNLTNWTVPTNEKLDGAGFYAGRVVEKENRHFISGWCGTLKTEMDGDPFDWGGNLVTHELKVRSNGELYITPINEIANHFSKDLPLTPISGVEAENGVFTYTNGGKTTYAKCPKKSWVCTYKIKFQSTGTLTMGFGSNNISVLNIDFNQEKGYLVYRVNNASASNTNIVQMPLSIALNEEVDVTLYGEDQIFAVYVKGKTGLTVRMMKAPGKNFGFYSNKANATISNLKFSH